MLKVHWALREAETRGKWAQRERTGSTGLACRGADSAAAVAAVAVVVVVAGS